MYIFVQVEIETSEATESGDIAEISCIVRETTVEQEERVDEEVEETSEERRHIRRMREVVNEEIRETTTTKVT